MDKQSSLVNRKRFKSSLDVEKTQIFMDKQSSLFTKKRFYSLSDVGKNTYFY